MTDSSFIENEDRKALRKAVSEWASSYGSEYYLKKARAHEHTDELWSEAGKLGFLGVNLPEEYGGGGAGMYELSLVMEEMAAAGSALLLMVVSPAINGTIISKFGTEEQKKRWIPGIADGTLTMAFAHHRTRRRLQLAQDHHHRPPRRQRLDPQGPEGLHLRRRPGAGRAGGGAHRGSQDRQAASRRCSWCPPMRPASPTRRSTWRSSAPSGSSRCSSTTSGCPATRSSAPKTPRIAQLFAGLNPERIMGAASSVGMGRFALDRAADYVKTRQVWGTPIGAHQGLSHPLAQCHIEVELAKLMMQKAADALRQRRRRRRRRRPPTWRNTLRPRPRTRSVDQAVQSLGGNGLTKEYGVAAMLASARLGRIAPVSREMVLNFVAQTSLGLPRSY